MKRNSENSQKMFMREYKIYILFINERKNENRNGAPVTE